MIKGLASKKLLIFIIAIFMIIVGVIFVFIGPSGRSDKLTYDDYTIYENYTSGIEKYDSTVAVEGYPGGEKAFYINGKISTAKDKDFSVITFNLYDSSGKRLGKAVAGIKEMKKDKKYNFKAIALVKESEINNIDHFSLKSVKEK